MGFDIGCFRSLFEPDDEGQPFVGYCERIRDKTQDRQRLHEKGRSCMKENANEEERKFFFEGVRSDVDNQAFGRRVASHLV